MANKVWPPNLPKLWENGLALELEGKRYVGEIRSGGVASTDSPEGARPSNSRWYFTLDGKHIADFEADADDTVGSVTAQLKGAIDAIA